MHIINTHLYHLGLALLAVGSLTLAGCGDARSDSQAGQAKSTPDASAPARATTAATTGVKPYPLKTCIVTGNELGSMGDEQSLVHEGQEVKFCCTPCVQKFQENPSKYLSKLPPG